MADAIAELRRAIHREGFDTRKNNRNHWNVYDKDNNIVRSKGGIPLEFPATPGKRNRALNNAVAQLRDAKVLPRPTEVRERQRQVKLSRQRLADYQVALRGELKAVMQDYKLTQADVYRYGDWYADQHDLYHPPNSQNIVSRFISGKGLQQAAYDYLARTVSAIKASKGDFPRSAQILTMTQNEAPTPAPQPDEHEEVGVEVEGESTTRVVKVPKLALEVMQAIYRDDLDHDYVMNLVERVARLEQS